MWEFSIHKCNVIVFIANFLIKKKKKWNKFDNSKKAQFRKRYISNAKFLNLISLMKSVDTLVLFIISITVRNCGISDLIIETPSQLVLEQELTHLSFSTLFFLYINLASKTTRTKFVFPIYLNSVFISDVYKRLITRKPKQTVERIKRTQHRSSWPWRKSDVDQRIAADWEEGWVVVT